MLVLLLLLLLISLPHDSPAKMKTTRLKFIRTLLWHVFCVADGIINAPVISPENQVYSEQR